MSPEIMTKVSGCRLASVPASLSGYQRSLVRDEVYPGISAAAHCQVDGLLYLDVPADALRRLDIFEGEMYERLEVLVQQEGCPARKAMTYAFRPEYLQLLTGIPWELEHFMVSGKKRFEDGYGGFAEIESHP